MSPWSPAEDAKLCASLGISQKERAGMVPDGSSDAATGSAERIDQYRGEVRAYCIAIVICLSGTVGFLAAFTVKIARLAR